MFYYATSYKIIFLKLKLNYPIVYTDIFIEYILLYTLWKSSKILDIQVWLVTLHSNDRIN